MIYTYTQEGFCCIPRIEQFQPNIVNNSKRISSNFGVLSRHLFSERDVDPSRNRPDIAKTFEKQSFQVFDS